MSRLVHLTIKNNSGSTEHFYHFVLGFLLPLANYLSRGENPEADVLLLRSCGPFDQILHELALPGLVLCGRRSHGSSKCVVMGIPGAGIDEIPGFDIEKFQQEQVVHDAAGVGAGIGFLRQRLGGAIAAAVDRIEQDWHGAPRILLIERGAADPFYGSPLCDDANPIFRTAGTQRRLIANHADLVRCLGGAFSGLRNVMLEGMPLAEQMAWFGLADIVIAQHGAALINVIWMRRGAQVIEIDPDMNNFVFSRLAEVSGLEYQRLGQPGGVFGDVAIDEVLAAVGGMVGFLKGS